MTRIALRIAHDTPCPECGYNLRGLRLDGNCPECGRPTADTFARPVNAVDATLSAAWLTRGGQAMALLAFTGWVSRVPTFGVVGIWASVVSVAVVAVPALLVAKGMRQDLGLLRAFRVGRSLRPYSLPVTGLLLASIATPLAAAATVQTYITFVTVLAGGFLATAIALCLASIDASDLLRRGSHGNTIRHGRIVLPVTVLLSAACSIPIPVGGSEVVVAQLVGLPVVGVLFWSIWRQFDLALSRAQGPVSSL